MDLEYNQGILFVRLKGNLNRRSSFKINNYLNPVIEKHKIKYLVYNLYSLEDIDDEGMDAILNTKYAIKDNLGKILMCEINKNLASKLKKVKIKKIDNEIEAINLIEV